MSSRWPLAAWTSGKALRASAIYVRHSESNLFNSNIESSQVRDLLELGAIN